MLNDYWGWRNMLTVTLHTMLDILDMICRLADLQIF